MVDSCSLPEKCIDSRFGIKYKAETLQLNLDLLIDVIVVPDARYVSYTGGQAHFFCFALDLTRLIVNVGWFVNGPSLESLNNNSPMAETTSDGRHRLTFSNLSVEYNWTTVACEVTFNVGSPATSNSVLLLLQGK